MSAQAKPISEVVKDFEQSLENLRPSTRRVYLAGARSALRAANLELWQCPSATEILASLGNFPTEKRVRISPFLDFLGDGESKELVSDEDSAALQNWVIQRLSKETRSVKNPSIATQERLGADRRALRGAGQRNASKMASKLPQNRGPRSASMGHGNRGTVLLFPCASGMPGESAWPARTNGGFIANLSIGANQGSFSPGPTALP